MKWNKETLDNAINHLLPDVKKAKESGNVFNRVKLMTMIAEDQFIKTNTAKQKKIEHNESLAVLIVAEAMSELFKDGEISFGNETLDFN